MIPVKKLVWGGFLGGVVVAAVLLWWIMRPVASESHRAMVAGTDATPVVPNAGGSGFDPHLPKPARRPVFDPEELRARTEAHRGFMIISAANADLTKESLRDVVQRLLDRVTAGDTSADREISDILFECERNASMVKGNTSGLELEFIQRIEMAASQCSQLDPSLGNSADRMLQAAKAGDRQARLRLRSSFNRLSGGQNARKEGRELAMRYVKELARSGDSMAMLALAEEHVSGRNLPRDPIAAYACYETALPGLPTIERRGAEYAMQLLRQRLTDDEIRQAKAREKKQLFD